MFVDIFGLFSLLRACDVSVAASGSFSDVGESIFSSKAVWRGPGRPKLMCCQHCVALKTGKRSFFCFLFLLIQLIDGNYIFSSLLANVPPGPKMAIVTPLKSGALGRRQQLRKHCAVELGAPIVNEEPALFDQAAPVWASRYDGATLPPAEKRGTGKLFLQAIELKVPHPSHNEGGKEEFLFDSSPDSVSVRVEASIHFEQLLENAVQVWTWHQDRNQQLQVSNDHQTPLAPASDTSASTSPSAS